MALQPNFKPGLNAIEQMANSFEMNPTALCKKPLASDWPVEMTAAELMKMPPDAAPCLWDPLLQRVGIACLCGTSDAGKSVFLRQLALAIVQRCDSFLHLPLYPQHNSVIYVATEDGHLDTRNALLKTAGQDLPEKEGERLRFIFNGEDLIEKLGTRLSEQPADLVVVDCFADMYGGDLKDTTGIRQTLQGYQDLARQHQCLILFLHHTGKRTEYLEPSKNNLLSGQGLEGKMRLVIEMRPDPVAPHLRHLCVVKCNYLAAEHKTHSYVLQFDETTLTYTNTGHRTSLANLTKQTDKDTKERQRYAEASTLKAAGKTYDQIAEQLGFGSKGTVSKLFDKGRGNGWPANVSNGNEMET